MINTPNLSSKAQGLYNYIDGIYAEFCLSSGLKATGIFVILLSRDGLNAIEKQSSKQSLRKVD